MTSPTRIERLNRPKSQIEPCHRWLLEPTMSRLRHVMAGSNFPLVCHTRRTAPRSVLTRSPPPPLLLQGPRHRLAILSSTNRLLQAFGVASPAPLALLNPSQPALLVTAAAYVLRRHPSRAHRKARAHARAHEDRSLARSLAYTVAGTKVGTPRTAAWAAVPMHATSGPSKAVLSESDCARPDLLD